MEGGIGLKGLTATVLLLLLQITMYYLEGAGVGLDSAGLYGDIKWKEIAITIFILCIIVDDCRRKIHVRSTVVDSASTELTLAYARR
jgi:hypothetical protein